MCIIFYNHSGAQYNKELLEIAYENNKHGAGLMWSDNNELKTIKGIWSFSSLEFLLAKFAGKPHALHLRWRTKGPIESEMCHPFTFSPKKDEKIGIMHNGTFEKLENVDGKSDTFVFARKINQIISKYDSEVLFHERFIKTIEKISGKHNKILFMSNSGKVAVANSNEWTEVDGILCSNTYSFERGYRERKTNQDKKV